MSVDQAETLRMYTALRLLRMGWAGSLLLGVGLNQRGRSLALASLAAGAASLFVEADPIELREAQRQGCCTFSVTTLDEALRALKNELRQGRAIVVGLSGDPARWLADMVERGVQPQALAFAGDPVAVESSSIRVLLQRGAEAMHGLGLAAGHGGTDLHAMLSEAMAGAWQVDVDVASNLIERRGRDREMFAQAELLAAGGNAIAGAAVRWLREAPTLFPRALDRAFWTRAF